MRYTAFLTKLATEANMGNRMQRQLDALLVPHILAYLSGQPVLSYMAPVRMPMLKHIQMAPADVHTLSTQWPCAQKGTMFSPE